MMITFGVFVGIAVLAVWLYLAFVLRGDIDGALDQTLREQAERVALLIDSSDPDERQSVARDFAQLAEFHLTVASGETVVWEEMRLPDHLSSAVLRVGALEKLDQGQQRIDLVRSDEGEVVHYVTVRPDGSDTTVRVGQGEPRLLQLVNRMKATLFVGMVLALALALLGSWTAAQRVTLPLQEIRNNAKRIAEGDIDRKIRVDSRAAEFQDLEESLNRMSDSFREKIDNLQRMAAVQNEFIGNVSHEVRNPIFAVGGYLEALSTPGLTDEQRALYGEKALANLQRLSNLFNDLIEIARLEYREDIISPGVFDLAELVHEVGETLRQKASEKGLNLEIDNPSMFVEADRNRIRQVVVNLVENAIAYSDEGTIRCRIGRRQDRVRVEVVDSGRGIPEDHLERVFERFYRVDPDRSRRSGGTGLGLSIVKQILQAHGQQIHVESTVGSGTRFWFDLPYAETLEPVVA
ncbi:MAG: HAMP domain-containing histidine kinase [Rhodothermia bacterium]|nr:HAMP domain-containing histidine kinase [Rhodothermia bacterium]